MHWRHQVTMNCFPLGPICYLWSVSLSRSNQWWWMLTHPLGIQMCSLSFDTGFLSTPQKSSIPHAVAGTGRGSASCRPACATVKLRRMCMSSPYARKAETPTCFVHTSVICLVSLNWSVLYNYRSAVKHKVGGDVRVKALCFTWTSSKQVLLPYCSLTSLIQKDRPGPSTLKVVWVMSVSITKPWEFLSVPFLLPVSF